MGTTITRIEDKKESIMDDLTTKDEGPKLVEKQEQSIDEEKLAALKARLASKMKDKEETMSKQVVVKREKSINFGFLGLGQGGARLAEECYRRKCDSIAINTAKQDLSFINIPESNKLWLDYGIQGAAKNLDLGKMAAESNREQISNIINTQLADADAFLVCSSLGGGSGAGAIETVIDILNGIGKPISVICILPMDSEDGSTKNNALITLSKLSKLTQTGKISSIICVDNAKLEAIYSNVGQMDFYSTANSAIIDIIDTFNTFSAMPSPSKGIDSAEWAKMILSQGFATYGHMKVSNYDIDEDAISLAIIDSLNNNLLADGFDLKQAQYVGVIFTASQKVWSRISASQTNYAMSMISDICGSPQSIFKGIYVSDTSEDCVNVYSFFSGLGLPDKRVSQLQKEASALMANNKTKDVQRNLALNMDTGDANVNKVQELKNRIANKSSAFGKLIGKNVVDRRK